MHRTFLIQLAAGCFAFALGLLADAAGAVPLRPAAAGAAKTAPLDLGPALDAGLDRAAPCRPRLPRRLLVLLVDFADHPQAANHTPAAMDSLFFGHGADSVREFYLRSSYGRLRLEGQVSSWLRMPQTYAYYADGEHRGVLGAYPRNARRMVEDAVRAADTQVDFALFDDDGPDGVAASGDDDGVVDALVVVHAGDGSELGDPHDILSHNWFTLDAVHTAEGVAVWTYATVSENSELGVRAHEFGHQLGLPDLYDRRSTTRLGGGLGDWSLMASGAWLDQGRHPADLDAPSKLELGFVDAVVPQASSTNLPLRAARDGIAPDLYRIWTHGLPGPEYFVIENRRRSAFEDFLPGGGMLVYHVDLDRPHNDDPQAPRIQLLQADGDEDIERRINNGDPGDPYPGETGNVLLTAGSVPSSRARDGRDSQVALRVTSPPTASMSFDLQLESSPELVLQGRACRELRGDGDGVPSAGETLALELLLRNVGLDTGALTLQLRAEPVADASWNLDRVMLAQLAKQDTVRLRFELEPRAGLGDPGAVQLRAAVAAASGWSQEIAFDLGLGVRAGFEACLGAQASRFTRDCSDPALPWSVQVRRGQGAWTLEERAGEFSRVYRSARGARYANGVDVTLVSPAFNLRGGSELRLLHAYDTQDLGAGWAMDGGRVEMSLDGGVWGGLEPRGGYPRRLWRDSVPGLLDSGVFAGRSARRWDVFALGTREGSARLRFRFVSDDSLGGAGWEIARLEVSTSAADTLAGIALAVEPNPVRFPARVAFRISSPLTAAARATRLRICDVRGRLVRLLEHVPVPAESAYFEWDGTDRAGHRVPSGLYIARLEWGGARASCKLIVLR